MEILRGHCCASVQPITDDVNSMECLLTEDFHLKTKHCSLRVINNNFEKGKRGAPIWFRDIYSIFNYRGAFLGFRSIWGELFFSRRLFEWDLLPFYEMIYTKREIHQTKVHIMWDEVNKNSSSKLKTVTKKNWNNFLKKTVFGNL